MDSLSAAKHLFRLPAPLGQNSRRILKSSRLKNRKPGKGMGLQTRLSMLLCLSTSHILR